MKLKSQFLLLPLLAVLVVSYQNCGGQMTSIVSDRWAQGSGGNSYLDGLPAGITQTGKAFTRDPATDSGNQSLSLTTNLSTHGSEVSIKHLKNLSYLSNGYISFPDDSMASSEIASPQASLVYPPTSARFQQVNAYFHLDTLIADMAGMSMFPSTFTPLKVDAHCDDAEDNAYYDYENHQLCLGYTDVNTTTTLWAADDLDVTVHEFGHALNHHFATTEVITSTPDLGAVDEGFADLWAYRQTLDPKVSVWFGRALYNNARASLRNLSTVTNYPSAYIDEVHADASFLSGAVYQVEKDANLSTEGKTKLEKRLLESLQYGHGMQDAIVALQDEAADLGINSSTVSSALSARGLLRNDAVAEVQLNSSKPIYVVDNHVFAYQENGNCNGALDSGERVFLFPNIENTGTIKGGVAMELTSQTSGVTVATGGDFGFAYRLKANSTFASELSGMDKEETDYLYRMIAPSFAIAVGSGVSGTANFTLKISTMNTVTGTPNTKNVTFSLPIGSVANSSSCTSLTVMP